MRTLKQVRDLTALMLSAAKLDGIKVELTNGSLSDADVPHGTVSFGGFDIGYGDTVDEWKLTRTVLVRGVYRWADGSGEPASADVIDIAQNTQPWLLVKQAVLLLVEEAIDNVLSAQAEADFARAASAAEEDAERDE